MEQVDCSDVEGHSRDTDVLLYVLVWRKSCTTRRGGREFSSCVYAIVCFAERERKKNTLLMKTPQGSTTTSVQLYELYHLYSAYLQQ